MFSVYTCYFAVLSAVLAARLWQQRGSKRAARGDSTGGVLAGGSGRDFTLFQRKFLAVYLLATAGDWVQGAYVYQLYAHYNFSRKHSGYLFLVGFLFASVSGLFVGALMDVFGRRRACLAYGMLYILGCATKHSGSFAVLALGRAACGVATALLFTAFESWLVSAHRARGFSEEELQGTFSLMSVCNGLVAVLSGLGAQLAVDVAGGHIVAAFDLAALLLAAMMVAVLAFFPPDAQASRAAATTTVAVDTDDGKPEGEGGRAAGREGPLAVMRSGVEALRRNHSLLWITGVVSCFESAMYTFVFLWTPALTAPDADPSAASLPLGLIFACFMLTCSIGGTFSGVAPEAAARHLALVCAAAAAALVVPCLVRGVPAVLLPCFFALEAAVGMYYPLVGMLRATHVPEPLRGTLNSFIRIPYSLIVCLVFVTQGDAKGTQAIFAFCVLLLLVGAFCARQLIHH